MVSRLRRVVVHRYERINFRFPRKTGETTRRGEARQLRLFGHVPHVAALRAYRSPCRRGECMSGDVYYTCIWTGAALVDKVSTHERRSAEGDTTGSRMV